MGEPKQANLTSKQELEDWLIKLLQEKGKMTTQQIKDIAENEGLSCPDEPVRFLNKLRVKGIIKGQISIEHKGWLWWV
jgi:hypothetical protein